MSSDNFTFLVYGLSIAWLILFAYVALLAARDRHLRRQIEQIKQMLQQDKRG
jgi:CcmD family protein